MDNIYAHHGDKVIFVNPDQGMPEDRITARILTVGKTYTVDRTFVHAWHTEVWLQEFPGVAFNSVIFENVNPEAPGQRGPGQ